MIRRIAPAFLRPPLFMLLLVAMLAPALAGCALQPLYAGGRGGAVASTLSSVSVAPVAGETGWLVHNALVDKLSASGSSETRYRIDVRLEDSIAGFGVRADDSVTRERRTLRARWQLVDTVSGATVIDATAVSDSGIDAVGSEYATIAAERTAIEQLSDTVADQIIARVAVYARNQAAQPGAR